MRFSVSIRLPATFSVKIRPGHAERFYSVGFAPPDAKPNVRLFQAGEAPNEAFAKRFLGKSGFAAQNKNGAFSVTVAQNI